jgi:micrococcal nuclease
MMNIKILCIAIAFLFVFSSCTPKRPAQPVVAAKVKELQQYTLQAIAAATLTPPTETPAPTETQTPSLTPTEPLPIPTATIALAPCLLTDAQQQTGLVTSVIDGDTIQVQIDGKEYQVRYIGIDAPEDTTIKERYGPEATTANRQLVENKTVTLFKDTSDTDRYNRLLRYVYVGDTFINHELVRRGLATAVSAPPNTACYRHFLQGEQEANSKRAGLWSRRTPTQTPLGFGLENDHSVQTQTPTEPVVYTLEAACNCEGDDLDCGDFSTQRAAQACYKYCVSLGLGDIFGLDGADHNYRACDSLP